jgi:hypothetical protein
VKKRWGLRFILDFVIIKKNGFKNNFYTAKPKSEHPRHSCNNANLIQRKFCLTKIIFNSKNAKK